MGRPGSWRVGVLTPPTLTERTPVTSATANPEARLLVVDDEPNIVELLSASLRFAGFEVATASDGQQALSQAQDLPARPADPRRDDA